jgi:hypothetical protein
VSRAADGNELVSMKTKRESEIEVQSFFGLESVLARSESKEKACLTIACLARLAW